MKEEAQRAKKSSIDMRFQTFQIPPAGEVLVLAKECPIGALAAKKMLDTVAPTQFELIQCDDDLVDGILLKRFLLRRTNKEALVNAIMEEAKQIMGPTCMLSINCDISVRISREL